jgi:hypothetical protein
VTCAGLLMPLAIMAIPALILLPPLALPAIPLALLAVPFLLIRSLRRRRVSVRRVAPSGEPLAAQSLHH